VGFDGGDVHLQVLDAGFAEGEQPLRPFELDGAFVETEGLTNDCFRI
jgi:hypothetical protein